MNPVFQHNACGACQFLGHYNGHDLYFCSGGPPTTVIARHGNEPDAYVSGLEVAKSFSLERTGDAPELAPLRVAYLIAVDKGLIRSSR